MIRLHRVGLVVTGEASIAVAVGGVWARVPVTSPTELIEDRLDVIGEGGATSLLDAAAPLFTGATTVIVGPAGFAVTAGLADGAAVDVVILTPVAAVVVAVVVAVAVAVVVAVTAVVAVVAVVVVVVAHVRGAGVTVVTGAGVFALEGVLVADGDGTDVIAVTGIVTTAAATTPVAAALLPIAAGDALADASVALLVVVAAAAADATAAVISTLLAVGAGGLALEDLSLIHI